MPRDKKPRGKKRKAEVLKEERVLVQVSEPSKFGSLSAQEERYFLEASETFQALTNVRDPPEAENDTPSDLELFHDSVFAELRGKELKVAVHPLCSRFFEQLLEMGSSENIATVFAAFSGSILPLAKDPFASHVCERLFKAATSKLSATTEIHVDGATTSMENLILYASAELRPGFVDSLGHTYSSHVARTLLEELLRANELSKTKKIKEKNCDPSFYSSATDLLHEAQKVVSSDDLKRYVFHKTLCPSLCALLKAEHRIGQEALRIATLEYLWPDRKIVSTSDSKATLKEAMFHKIGSFLVETIIQTSDSDILGAMYRSCLKGSLLSFIRHPAASSVMQKFLQLTEKKSIVQEIKQELQPSMKKLVDFNRVSLLRVLIEKLAEFDLLDEAFVTDFCATFDAKNHEDIIVQLIPISVDMNAERDGSLQGSLLAQKCFEFKNPSLAKLLIGSILAQSGPLLFDMSCDGICSRIIETAMKSSNMEAPQKRILLTKLNPYFAQLAADPSGSHVVDAALSCSRGLNYFREMIAKSLEAKAEEVKERWCGRRVWDNWHMDTFRRKRYQWLGELSTY